MIINSNKELFAIKHQYSLVEMLLVIKDFVRVKKGAAVTP